MGETDRIDRGSNIELERAAKQQFSMCRYAVGIYESGR
jgi:hypothetical protein